jgi:hypothetical protein
MFGMAWDIWREDRLMEQRVRFDKYLRNRSIGKQVAFYKRLKNRKKTAKRGY